jgi:anaerobic selenocysteine-containing dehydrogenase
VLWGSNAREVHPIFFHHMLKGVRRGARLYAADPRRTSSAQWADAWLGIDVGSDISLANAIGREIIEAGLVNETFVERATTGYDVPFATKPQLVRQMIERAVHAGVPFSWVAGDEVYGGNPGAARMAGEGGGQLRAGRGLR